MKVLVIPDVHNKVHLVEGIFKKETSADRAIFLGDIFDDYDDNPDIVKGVAKWVKRYLADSRVTFLWGNHDVSYAFPNGTTKFYGYTEQKFRAIREILSEDHFAQWKFFWACQGFLLTHAGLHPDFLPPFWREQDVTMDKVKKFLHVESEKCLREISDPQGYHWFFLIGDARCRFKRGAKAGGILWCDAREEFESVPNLSQVFGHTIRKFPEIIFGDTNLGRICHPEVLKMTIGYENHCNVALDCHLKYYGIIEDGVLTLHETPNYF